jgi:hypothetical protein
VLTNNGALSSRWCVNNTNKVCLISSRHAQLIIKSDQLRAMATISLLLRNRSKAAKHISDFTLVLKDFLINNSGLNKDALFRFKNSELVIMQAPESWLKCRENSCFILYQPHKETYTVNGSAEEEVCFLVKYSALVRFLDPIRKSLASLRMVFTDKDTEV